jgi:predicted glycogen debranching enzyme
MYQKEIESRTRRTSFYNCLKNSAKQFYLSRGDDMYMLSGYPWGTVLARNTFMSLPGNTLTIGHQKDFERIMATAAAALRRFMDSGEISPIIHGIDLPDIPLWAVWATQQYAKTAGLDAARGLYGALVADVLDYIIDDCHPNLRVAIDGLVETEGAGWPVSWMNSTIEGKPVVPRTGKLVEFNALWYNALRYGCRLAGDDPELKPRAERWDKAARLLADHFASTFLNDYGYLYDYVDGTYADPSVRPNMVIAIGLDHSPLDRRQRKRVLDVATRELLTPKGLRTLSPKSYGYRPFYLGSPREREEALHQGPARPWLMGFYADAYLKVFGMSGVSYIDRMLIGFEEEMSQGCIGSLSQLYDGNPPFAGRGAISHATNVAGVLRTLRTLKLMEPDTAGGLPEK